ncbi:hypothetical protein PGTUg99_037691 [Puccinia graminis f. sp. tritici]|uniref:Uncharacterized protein n=1 Tax=Puccinia graminis f. sp. tritici TaxID=56615 RepID=A0A5B0SQ59_PUCGR|nr:hypothetical protein PGTUg99_037691 [Puccinia graminis f. sp. tritici]
MIHPIQALSAYIYKYCDKTSSRHVNDRAITQVSHSKATRALTAPQANTSDVSEPPPYGDVLPPPAYQTIVGRLCLIDRTDQTFKIYQTDLMMLSREWTRRSQLKRDALESVIGGPKMAPRRVVIMIDLFMSIVQHQPCPRPNGAPSCECRIKRWACLKQEWIEVMFLLGNQC